MVKKKIHSKMVYTTYWPKPGGLELDNCTPQYTVLWILNASSTTAMMLIIDKVVQIAKWVMLGRCDCLLFASANSASSDADFDSDSE
jgi:hypothetical protein